MMIEWKEKQRKLILNFKYSAMGLSHFTWILRQFTMAMTMHLLQVGYTNIRCSFYFLHYFFSVFVLIHLFEISIIQWHEWHFIILRRLRKCHRKVGVIWIAYCTVYIMRHYQTVRKQYYTNNKTSLNKIYYNVIHLTFLHNYSSTTMIYLYPNTIVNTNASTIDHFHHLLKLIDVTTMSEMSYLIQVLLCFRFHFTKFSSSWFSLLNNLIMPLVTFIAKF